MRFVSFLARLILFLSRLVLFLARGRKKTVSTTESLTKTLYNIHVEDDMKWVASRMKQDASREKWVERWQLTFERYCHVTVVRANLILSNSQGLLTDINLLINHLCCTVGLVSYMYTSSYCTKLVGDVKEPTHQCCSKSECTRWCCGLGTDEARNVHNWTAGIFTGYE